LQAGIHDAVLPQQGAVGQVLVHEIPGVGVLVVQVADAGQELAAADLQAGGQAAGVEVGLLQFHAAAGVHGHHQVGVEVRVDAGGEGDLRGAQVEAPLQFAVAVALMVVAVVDAVDVLVFLWPGAALVVAVVDAVQDHRDLGVEGGAGADLAQAVAARRGGAFRAGGLLFGGLQAGLHFRQAGFI
jgi:hypothetical protein